MHSGRRRLGTALAVAAVVLAGGILASEPDHGRPAPPRTAAAVKAQTRPPPSQEPARAKPPHPSDAWKFVRDLGVGGILGTVLGTILGAVVSARIAKRTRRDEREKGSLSVLDQALADTWRSADDLLARGDNAGGIRKATQTYQLQYARHAPGLQSPALHGRLKSVAALLSRSETIVQGRGGIDPGLRDGLHRAIANARAGLGALMRDEPLPENGFPGAAEVLELVDASPGTQLPFEGLRSWLQDNPPSASLTPYLEEWI
jgi:hypothetical protein